MKTSKTASVTASLILLLATAGARAGERWLHVRVAEGSGGEQVSVNLPLSAIESLLPLLSETGAAGGGLGVDLDGFEGVRLNDLLSAIRDAPDAEFVTIQSAEESVRVAKEDGFLLVRVDERGEAGEQIRIRLPLAVAEALVGDDGESLDLAAALAELERFDGEDLVRIESSEESVRIWIDSSESGS